MVETVLVLPLLLLLAAGLFQTVALLLASIDFEQACHATARRYAAGELAGPREVPEAVWQALGPTQKRFRRSSIQIADSTGEIVNSLSSWETNQGGSGLSSFRQVAQKFAPEYEKQTWRVKASFMPPPLFLKLFPRGIPLASELCVYRYLARCP
jgi:hypothetical protein